MPLVAIQCKNCGGELQVDSASKSYFCHHCHTAYAMEESVIQNITNTTTTIGHVENMIDDGSGKIDQEIYGAEQQLYFKRYNVALERFEKLTYEYGHKYRAWWGLIRAKTEDFTKGPGGRSEYYEICGLFRNLLQFETVPADEKSEWDRRYTQYLEMGQGIIDRLEQTRNSKLEDLENRKNKELAPKKEQLMKLEDKIAAKERKAAKVESISVVAPFVAAGLVAALLLVLMVIAGEFSGALLSLVGSALIAFIVVKLPLWIVHKTVDKITFEVVYSLKKKMEKLQESVNHIEYEFNMEEHNIRVDTAWLDY